MKHGTEYGKRVKRLMHEWLRKFGQPEESEPTEPIEQLIIGILAGCTSYTKAAAAFRALREQMVDLNELRVTPPMELAEVIGDTVPQARQKAHRIVDALNAIRRRQDSLDLSFLRQRGRREARDYLESLEGVDRGAAASVVLYSLGGHAIPVDELTVYVLRKEGVVEPHAGIEEVQSFLERHVPAAQARTFAELLTRYVAGKAGRVPLDKLAELFRPPAPRAPAQTAADDGSLTAPPEPATAARHGSSSKPSAGGKSAPVADSHRPTAKVLATKNKK